MRIIRKIITLKLFAVSLICLVPIVLQAQTRSFSDFEKTALKQLVVVDANRPNVLNYISNTILYDRGIEINENERTITLLQRKGDEQNAYNELFELISLLHYLEDHYLIFITTNPNPFPGNFVTKNLTQQTLNQKGSEFSQRPIPTTLYDIIIRYRNSFLFVVPEMKELVNNNFKSIEQIQYETELSEVRRQTTFSRNSFYVAIVALILTLIAQFVFKPKINKFQMQKIIKELQNIRNSLNERNSDVVKRTPNTRPSKNKKR